MRRRDFIKVLAGTSVGWPVVVRAQQSDGMRRIGVLIGGPATDDPEMQARTDALTQALHQFGWIEGHNLQIDYRSSAGNEERARKFAAELVALKPDVLVASSAATVASLLQVTRTVPIVFANAVDPVGAGLIESLARPGGNVTGFVQFEYNLSAKWLELLKQIAPSVTRAAVLRDAAVAGVGQFAVIQSVAPTVGIDVSPINVGNPDEIDRAVTAFARTANGGLIVTSSGLAAVHRKLIIGLAARHKLPAVYYRRGYVVDGGLISYGPDFIDQYRRSARYVDRILKGEKPADLPVQTPTKYELVVNLKTAKALGLTIPPSVLARADEVIE
jgi:putative tryptophan/tyrosine transport system substrate-binding protein